MVQAQSFVLECLSKDKSIALAIACLIVMHHACITYASVMFKDKQVLLSQGLG